MMLTVVVAVMMVMVMMGVMMWWRVKRRRLQVVVELVAMPRQKPKQSSWSGIQMLLDRNAKKPNIFLVVDVRPVKATKTEDEVSCKCEVKSRDVGDVEVDESAALADRGGGDSEGCFDVGGVGVMIFLADDALWHLLLVGGWWLVEFGELW